MRSPCPSNALGNVTPASEAKLCACGLPSLLTTPSTRTLPAAARSNCWRTGSSSRQGGHQLPQRLTSVGTPGAFARSSVPPPRQEKRSLGIVVVPEAAVSGWAGQACVVVTAVGALGAEALAPPPDPPVQPARRASSTGRTRADRERRGITRCPRP